MAHSGPKGAVKPQDKTQDIALAHKVSQSLRTAHKEGNGTIIDSRGLTEPGVSCLTAEHLANDKWESE